jgi:phosphoglycerate dehydrogenase-like enzyme
MTDCLIVSARADEYITVLADYEDLALSTTACMSLEQAAQRYSGQSIVFGDPDLVAPLLHAMPAVDWVQSTWAGVLPFVQADRRDYVLTGVKDVFGPQMSEYVLGHILALELKIAERARAQSNREWYRQPSGTLLGKSIGIMGTGSIGRHIGRVASGFGMRVSGLSRSGALLAGFDRVWPIEELHAFLQDLDYLVAALPQTSKTDNLLDGAAIAQLPAHAYLINVGRSNVLGENALSEALQSGNLAGAVLDVFDEEPLPQDSPLWTVPNLHVTAHISAVSHPSLVVPIFVDNLRRYQQQQNLEYVIDLDKGY